MGTLTLSYQGSPNGVATSLSASATISDADAATFIAWGLATQGGGRRFGQGGTPPQTAQDVFALIAAQWVQQITAQVAQWQTQQALQKVTITPIAITPVAAPASPSATPAAAKAGGKK
jgi:hypothetical protein